VIFARMFAMKLIGGDRTSNSVEVKGLLASWKRFFGLALRICSFGRR